MRQPLVLLDLLASVDHPRVVRYYDSFVDGGRLHIVMEHCERGDLAMLLEARAGAPLAEGDENVPDLDFILNPDNAYSNEEWPGTFVYESSAGIDTVSNVGIRLRGNTSRNAAKKSFKVSFNTFTQGASWNGLDKFNFKRLIILLIKGNGFIP